MVLCPLGQRQQLKQTWGASWDLAMALIKAFQADTRQQLQPHLRGARDALVPPDACVGSQSFPYYDCSAQAIAISEPSVNLTPSKVPGRRTFQPYNGIIKPRNAPLTISVDTGVINVCVSSSIC